MIVWGTGMHLWCKYPHKVGGIQTWTAECSYGRTEQMSCRVQGKGPCGFSLHFQRNFLHWGGEPCSNEWLLCGLLARDNFVLGLH